jgi:hypothetical protein
MKKKPKPANTIEPDDDDDRWPNTQRVPKFDPDTPPADKAPKESDATGDPWGDGR